MSKLRLILFIISISWLFSGCGDNDDSNPNTSFVNPNIAGSPFNNGFNNCLNNGFVDSSGRFVNCSSGICDTSTVPNANVSNCNGFNNGYINNYPFNRNTYNQGWNNGWQTGFNQCPAGSIPVHGNPGLGCVPNSVISGGNYRWAWWEWDPYSSNFNPYQNGRPYDYYNGYYGIQACNYSGGCGWSGTQCHPTFGLCFWASGYIGF